MTINNVSFSAQLHYANEEMSKTYKYTLFKHVRTKLDLERDPSLTTALKTQLLYAGLTNPEGMAVEGFDPSTLDDRDFTQLYAILEDYQVYCENQKYTLEATAFRTLLTIQMNKKFESVNKEMKQISCYPLYDHANEYFNLERDSSLFSNLKLLASIAAQIAESQDQHLAIDHMHHNWKVQKGMAPHLIVTDEIQEIQNSKALKEGIAALSAIEELQTINVLSEEENEHKQIKQNRFNQWIENSLHSLTAESLNSLDKSHSYQLAALLVATESLFSDSLKLEQAVKALPNGAKDFYDHLKQLPKAGKDKIIELNNIYKDSKDKYLVIGSTINAFKIPLKDVKDIEGIDLREFGSYLTYADFREFNDAEAEVKLLQNYHNLHFLFIKNRIIKSLPALPNLEVLNCSGCSSLPNLPNELPNLEVLNCSGCSSLPNLPNELPNLQELKCFGCDQLINLPNALPNLQKLICFSSIRLINLPSELPNLQELKCSWCPQISNLPNALPNLQDLNCAGCDQLTKLPNVMPNLRVLDCSDCSSLPNLPNELPNLRVLKCSSCHQLTNLPSELPNLRKLDCSFCNRLTSLSSAMPNLQVLYCYFCAQLTSLLSALPNLKELICNDCHQLTILPNALPNLQKLKCSYCAALTNFPSELPNLQWLDCSYCVFLERLPHLPSCNELDCENTPLEEFPIVPAGCQVYIGVNHNFTDHTLTLEASQLQDNPRWCLRELYENYLKPKKLFPKIRFLEAPDVISLAADVGGLRRTLISTLFNSLLISKDFPQRLPREGIWPVLDENTNEITYQAIGALLALCFRKRSCYNSGDIFALEVYAAMQVLAAKDDDECIQSWLARIGYPLEIFKLCSPNIIETNISQNAIDYANAIFDDLSVDFLNEAVRNDEKIRAELRSKLLALIKGPINEVLKNTNIQKALEAIVNEMQEHLQENERKEFLTSSYQDLKNSIEGPITAEAILRHLEFDRSGTETEIWLRSWISERLGKEPESLRLFLIGITGNNGLSKEKIQIHLYEASIDPVKKCVEKLPTAHTCAYSIDIPSNYPNKEHLFKKMDLFLEGGQGHAGTSGFDSV